MWRKQAWEAERDREKQRKTETETQRDEMKGNRHKDGPDLIQIKVYDDHSQGLQSTCIKKLGDFWQKS